MTSRKSPGFESRHGQRQALCHASPDSETKGIIMTALLVISSRWSCCYFLPPPPPPLVLWRRRRCRQIASLWRIRGRHNEASPFIAGHKRCPLTNVRQCLTMGNSPPPASFPRDLHTVPRGLNGVRKEGRTSVFPAARGLQSFTTTKTG